jgi:hypothetical protein
MVGGGGGGWLSLKRSVDEADFLSGTFRRVTGGTGGLGGFPEVGAVEVVVVPPGPTVTDVGGLAYNDLGLIL